MKSYNITVDATGGQITLSDSKPTVEVGAKDPNNHAQVTWSFTNWPADLVPVLAFSDSSVIASTTGAPPNATTYEIQFPPGKLPQHTFTADYTVSADQQGLSTPAPPSASGNLVIDRSLDPPGNTYHPRHRRRPDSRAHAHLGA